MRTMYLIRKSFLAFRDSVVTLCDSFPAMLVFGAMVFLKLYLVSGFDIRAGYFPHDDWWCIRKAAVWYWGEPYDYMAFIKEPLTPLFIRLCAETGMPLRICFEVALAGAAFLFCRSLSVGGMANKAFQYLIFASIVFFPGTMQVFSVATADPLHASLMVLWMACAVRIVLAWMTGEDARGWSWILGVCSGLMAINRPEYFMVFIGMAVVIGALAGIGMLQGRMSEKRTRLILFRILCRSGGSALAIVLATCASNYCIVGFWGISEQVEHNYRRAFAAFRSVPSPGAGRYALIDNPAIERVAAVSPAVGMIAPDLLSAASRWNHIVEIAYQPTNTTAITAGWFVWALRDAVASRNISCSAEASSRFYGRIADEIAGAQSLGALPRQSVLRYYFSEHPLRRMVDFGVAFTKMIRSSVSPRMGDDFYDMECPSKAIISDYSLLCNRRPATQTMTTQRGEVREIFGWFVNIDSHAVVKRIDVIRPIAAGVEAYRWNIRQRPDVAAYFKMASTNNALYGYSIILPREELLRDMTIVVTDGNGNRYSMGATSIARKKPKAGFYIKSDDGAARAYCWVDGNQRLMNHAYTAHVERKAKRTIAVMSALSCFWPWCVVGALIICGYGFYRTTTSCRVDMAILAGIAGACIAIRLVLLAIIDVTYAPGNLPRYLCPASIMILPVVLLAGSLAWARQRNCRSRPA